MKTLHSFTCPLCKISGAQGILFAGGEFQYICPKCNGIHLFTENLFYDLKDHFDHWYNQYNFGRYVGSYDIRSNKLVDRFGSTLPWTVAAKQIVYCIQALYSSKHSSYSLRMHVKKLSSKDRGNRPMFVANAMFSHFQDSVRAILRMYEHIRYRGGSDTYNVLIVSRSIGSLCFKPSWKIEGVDELIIADFDIHHQWSYRNESNAKKYAVLDYKITKWLNSFSNEAITISKRPGPIPEEPDAIKKILDPEGISAGLRGVVENAKFVVLLTRSDKANGRATLCEKEHLEAFIETIRSYDLVPVILTFGQEIEIEEFNDINVPVFKNLSLAEQSYFYKHCCVGVIGPNGSGCNFPTLWNIPILAFAKSRPFPDDFYCFGRMLFFDPDKYKFHGAIQKPENVTEVVMKGSQDINPFAYEKEIRIFLNSLKGKTLH